MISRSRSTTAPSPSGAINSRLVFSNRKIAVTAPPEDGKANAAVSKLLAKFFRTAKSNIAVVSGATARTKQLEIAGDGASLAAVLDAWAAAETGGGEKKGSSG